MFSIPDVPQAIVGEPEVSELGPDWVSLRWTRPPRGTAAPVLAYRVEGWLQGVEGGARWALLGLTPVNGFDAFRMAPGSYLFRVTPRNRYGWGESKQSSQAVQVGGKPTLPEFTTPLQGQVCNCFNIVRLSFNRTATYFTFDVESVWISGENLP